MPTANAERMTVTKIQRTLAKHRGSLTEIANELGTNLRNVSRVLRGNLGGRVGKELETRILALAERKATELLEARHAA